MYASGYNGTDGPQLSLGLQSNKTDRDHLLSIFSSSQILCIVHFIVFILYKTSIFCLVEQINLTDLIDLSNYRFKNTFY